MEPVNINSLLPLKDKLDDLEFRRVICKGVFDEKKSIFVGPRSRSISGVTENGHYVITPLMPILGLPDRYFPVPLLLSKLALYLSSVLNCSILEWCIYEPFCFACKFMAVEVASN